MNRERFKGAPWFNTISNKSVSIVGAGGIGSWLTLFLLRAGVKYTVLIDPDTVEEHNQGGQFYSIADVGKLKVTAIKDAMISYATGSRLYVENDMYSMNSSIHNDRDAIFSAVDNIPAREEIFQGFKSHRAEIFIDGRLEPEHLTVFAVTRDRIDRYEEVLSDPTEVEDLNCTFKQTSHVAAMIAGVMTSVYTNFLANNEVPFRIEWYLPAMHLEIED